MGCLLIVDDEVLAVDGLKKALRNQVAGIEEIVAAYDIGQAQKVFESRPVDVLITDIELPGENGLDLLAWVGEHHPDTKPIVLSCHPNFPYVQQALRLRSFDYLLKPIPSQELVEVIRRALGRPGSAAAGPKPPAPGDEAPAAAVNVAAWGLLLKAGAFEKVRFEALSHLKRQAAAVQNNGAFLESFVVDFQQLAYSHLHAKGIPAHQMLRDSGAAEAAARAARTPEDLRVWLEGVLTYLEKASLDLDQRDTPFGRACAYIAQHIAENLYCEDVADHVAVSRDYLSHLFKKKTGLSVNQYVIREKMAVAAGLLTNTQVPVCHIASGLGYANFSHFSQSFKKVYEVCPADFRAEHHRVHPLAVSENR